MFLVKLIDGQPTNKEPDKHAETDFFDLNNLPSPLGSTTKHGLQIMKSNWFCAKYNKKGD